LEHYFGFDAIRFEVSSDDVKDMRRSFTSFQACADEVSRSRVYGGIHYSSAGREGLVLGRKIATECLRITSPSSTAPHR
jgi:hypothetical protein